MEPRPVKREARRSGTGKPWQACRSRGRNVPGIGGGKQVLEQRRKKTTASRLTLLRVEELAGIQERVTQLHQGLLFRFARRKMRGPVNGGLAFEQLRAGDLFGCARQTNHGKLERRANRLLA